MPCRTWLRKPRNAIIQAQRDYTLRFLAQRNQAIITDMLPAEVVLAITILLALPVLLFTSHAKT